ncbi:hypothetical protein ACLOJK_016646 [Asimina triloba]
MGVDGIIAHTKTVAGHNLEPTPWHRFHAAPLEHLIEEDEDTGLDSFSRVSISRRWWRWWWSWYPRAATSRILHCSHFLTCLLPPPNSPIATNSKHPNQNSCPAFFQWIHQDLSPWATSRISAANLMEAQQHAAFRVVISGGRLFVEFYYACVQTRSMFTIWGLLQLLRRYPGLIPDVDLMFDCMDKPLIGRSDFKPGGRWPPPPLFRYCTTKDHFDIPFTDWSFWGPWDEEFRSIKVGSQELNWEKKTGTAYWKGNPDVASPVRVDLLKCNDTNAWGAQIFRQAEAIGKGGQDFMETLNMDRVYDYMYHLIVEYSKLLDFKPAPPSSAQEICEDYILCFADRKQRQLLKRSLTSSSLGPCTLPKPDDHFIETWIQEKQKITDDIQRLATTWNKNETVKS